MNEHILKVGDKAYHLHLGRVGTVLHVSAKRNAVLLRFADGTERSYPVDDLRAHDPTIDDRTRGWTVPCRVETNE